LFGGALALLRCLQWGWKLQYRDLEPERNWAKFSRRILCQGQVRVELSPADRVLARTSVPVDFDEAAGTGPARAWPDVRVQLYADGQRDVQPGNSQFTAMLSPIQSSGPKATRLAQTFLV
jgi:hypothetical protein